MRKDDEQSDNQLPKINQFWRKISSQRMINQRKSYKWQGPKSQQISQSSQTIPKQKQSNINLHLQDLLLKIKVQNLTKQFIYKLKRNIVQKNPIQYNVVQKNLIQKYNQEKLRKPFQMNQYLKASFLALNIICILMIQVLMNFQGFYPKLRLASATNPTMIALQIFCLVVFFFKIIMSMTTTRIIDGVGLKYLRDVAKYYTFSIIFLFDFLNFLMTLFKLIFPESIVITLSSFIVSLLSFPILSKNFEIIQVVFANTYRRRQYFSMMKIFIFNIFFAQFLSAILIAMAYWDISNNWIVKAQRNGNLADDITWWQLFFYSVYWAVVTTSTVGYGDLTPSNYFQAIMVSIIVLFGAVVLSYNISEIGSIISNLRSIDQQRREAVATFKRIVKDQKISKQLQGKILDYIQMSAKMKVEYQFIQRKKFAQTLPNQLRRELQEQYCQIFFSNVRFFQLLQRNTLIKLVLKMKGEIKYPTQMLTQPFCYLDKIIFLKNGKIGYSYYRQGSSLNGLVLQKRQRDKNKDSPFLLNKYFLTQDQEINYQIVALNYCFILVLQFEDFYEILRENKKDNEFFCFIYHKISFISQEWQTLQCKYCAPKRHTIFICPKFHYMPYRSWIFQKYIFSNGIPQNGDNSFKRKKCKFKKKKALYHWKNCYKTYQKKWQISYFKQMNKRININKQLSMKRILSYEQKLSQNQLMQQICQKILQKHCCQSSNIYFHDKQIQMDKLCDFDNFFPQFNPSLLININLKRKKKKIHILKGHLIDGNKQERSFDFYKRKFSH